MIIRSPRVQPGNLLVDAKTSFATMSGRKRHAGICMLWRMAPAGSNVDAAADINVPTTLAKSVENDPKRTRLRRLPILAALAYCALDRWIMV
jgi:hypothetical protein